MALEIRPATYSDMPDILALLIDHPQCYTTYKPVCNPSCIEENIRVILDTDNYCALIAEEENTLNGIISVVMYNTLFHHGPIGLINELAFNGSHENNNIPVQLLIELIHHAAQYNVTTLIADVHPRHRIARMFFKDEGFSHASGLWELSIDPSV